MIERPAPIARPVAPTSPRPEACYFRSDDRARFGWVHHPRRAPTGTALVIVPPFGYEALCAHRALRHLADDAAAAGLLAIRFDLDGTGDSAGDDLEPQRLAAWLASIDDACALARHHGAERVVLAGVRLGATLAALAAMARDDVAGLVAIAGVPAGKAYVREARALQLQLALAPAPSALFAPPQDVHELVGFALPAELRTQLAQIDLADHARAQKRPAPAVLLVDRDDLPGNDRWADTLRRLGAAVEQVRLPGYVDMVLDPHRAVVPRAIVDATVAFARSRPPTASPPARELAVAPRAEIAGGGASVTEQLVAIDDTLVAIASRLRTPPRRAVILLNAGSIHRVGPNRLHVAVARRLAAHGDLVLRVDLSGLGDSPPRRGAAENVVYSDHAVADVGACVAYARRQGAGRIAVVGLCSGAYHAIEAAIAGHPIDTVVPINPLTFFWHPGMPLDLAAFKDAQRYQRSARTLASWSKLARGDVDLRRVARVIAERGRAIAEHRARELLRRLRVPLRDDLGSKLYALGRAGVALRFIFAADDPGRALLVEQGGSAVRRLERAGKLSVAVIAGPDHTFTPRWSHAPLLDAIVRALRADDGSSPRAGGAGSRAVAS